MRKVLSVILCGALCSAFALENQKPFDDSEDGESSDTPDTPDTRDTDDPSDAGSDLDGLSDRFPSQSSWRSMFSFGVHGEAGAFLLKRTATIHRFFSDFQATEKWNTNVYGNLTFQARFTPVHWFSFVIGLGFQGEYAQRSSNEYTGYSYFFNDRYNGYDDPKQSATLYELLNQNRFIFTIPQFSSKFHIGIGTDVLMNFSEDEYSLRVKNASYGYGFLEVSYTINVSNSMTIDVGARGGALVDHTANYINDVKIDDYRAGIFVDAWLF